MSSQEKSPDAFRTISEVAEDLDLPQHVLRFWETRFSQIKPLKRGGGRRYYRPDDVELLKGIRHLLYGEGYTIKGVQRILKEQGPRFVMQIRHEDMTALQAVAASEPVPAEPAPAPVAVSHNGQHESHNGPLPNGVLADDEPEPASAHSHGHFSILGRLRGEKPAQGAGSHSSVTKEDIRRLQATLFELLECKRTLDQAR
ncbi:Bacterial regulatory protein, MerR family protein [Stappia aggregata IAM 12614]|uniref:Bacterial regulatory protein, MerR family protein n=1 Tax=Roseibium aggregatum (strain ATCC 25650 / DSM 13394 / JCM 20685 / NBRC 16684 / NCIMB 2208 / IAM 12614 / B1) TaxID=384765 RepID=A0NMF9_ROSAI|nr:MerR family transcriptional regulator [Roseibium aggregatum]EAV46254.1 Bacterial regulatory protein, MerR family protein [Stappia aggregata IAM 12614] [Roseibium aggregatum IAM 12614]